MKTVGEILKNSRLEKNLTLNEVSRKTRIQEGYLEALESNNFKSLPTLTFVKGFIQNYAKAIGVDPKTALAIFRRDFVPDSKGHIVPRSVVAPIEKKFTVSPKTTTTAIIAMMVIFIAVIFIRQIIIFYQGPEIVVDSPVTNQQVTSPIRVSGKVMRAESLTINSQPVAIAENGLFSTDMQFSPGEHTITITAVSPDGKTTTTWHQITVSP